MFYCIFIELYCSWVFCHILSYFHPFLLVCEFSRKAMMGPRKCVVCTTTCVLNFGTSTPVRHHVIHLCLSDTMPWCGTSMPVWLLVMIWYIYTCLPDTMSWCTSTPAYLTPCHDMVHLCHFSCIWHSLILAFNYI